jgi:hypothetical protein
MLSFDTIYSATLNIPRTESSRVKSSWPVSVPSIKTVASSCVTTLPSSALLSVLIQQLWAPAFFAEVTGFRAQAHWTLTHMSHKNTEKSTVETSITLDGVTLTDSLIRWSRMNDFQFARRYQCLSIRYSGRLVSLHNEHRILSVSFYSSCRSSPILPQYLHYVHDPSFYPATALWQRIAAVSMILFGSL